MMRAKPTMTPKKKSDAPDDRKFIVRHAKVILAVLVLAFIGIVTFTALVLTGDSEELAPLTETIEHINDGDVESAVVNENSRTVTITLNDDDETELSSVYTGLWSASLTDALLDNDVKSDVIAPKASSLLTSMLVSMLPLILLVGIVLVLMRGQLFKSRKFAQAEIPTDRFSDVAGADEAVSEMRELVQFLHKGDKFAAMGARTPRGALFVGPPGTGKTLLARAVAGEAGVPFFSVNGSHFVELFAGLGASRVRGLFKKAKEAGTAIIFIDEIDSVGRKRGNDSAGSGGVQEMENTLTALLAEMDGFEKTNVIVIGATNRLDVIDPALRRRLEHVIRVPLPDRRGRSLILQVHAKGKPFAEDVEWDAVGRQAYGMSGADLERVINEACMDTVRKDDYTVTTSHLMGALSTIQVGRERTSAALTERDKEITAWHEAGHAAVCVLSQNLTDPTFITIVPRGDSGGHTRPGGSDDTYRTNVQLFADLQMALGGRVGEEMLLGEGVHTQGALGDLAHATGLATEMLTQYGMGSRLAQTHQDSLRLGAQESQRVSEEVDNLLREALRSARELVSCNRLRVGELALALIEKETLTDKDIKAITEKWPRDEGVHVGADTLPGMEVG